MPMDACTPACCHRGTRASVLPDQVRERLDALRRTRIPRPGEAEAALVLTALLGIRLPPSGL
jgi:hypothetical protein